jgi:nicotinate-nucleotide--dimethylbenzimidazole phosphoribosyltransferase
VIVLAADHGVETEGVSAYPQAVTAQMVRNFLSGGAAINVLARQAGARVVVVDIGVASELPPDLRLVSRKIAYGSGNIATGPAMDRTSGLEAIEAGIDVLESQLALGLDLVATGDMGIANTTAASAVIAAMSGQSPLAVTGRGTGLDDAELAHKVDVIDRSLAVNHPDPSDPLDVLTRVGGFEIAGLVGVIIAAACHRVPVLLDGLTSGAAALLATAMAPNSRHYLIAAHRSMEPGHRIALEHLELAPLLSLDMRLGEGTGATVAMHLVDDAVAILDEMATFDEAGVDEGVGGQAPGAREQNEGSAEKTGPRFPGIGGDALGPNLAIEPLPPTPRTAPLAPDLQTT